MIKIKMFTMLFVGVLLSVGGNWLMNRYFFEPNEVSRGFVMLFALVWGLAVGFLPAPWVKRWLMSRKFANGDGLYINPVPNMRVFVEMIGGGGGKKDRSDQ